MKFHNKDNDFIKNRYAKVANIIINNKRYDAFYDYIYDFLNVGIIGIAFQLSEWLDNEYLI